MKYFLGMATALLLLLSGAACSDDKKPEEQARATSSPSPTPSPTPPPATPGDCFAGLRSYRYAGTLDIKLPSSLGGANFRDIAVSGAQVSPDRNQTRLTAPQGTFELIAIGDDIWVKAGNGAWQKNPRDLGTQFNINPGDICRTGPAELERLGVTPVREQVNGAGTLKYVATKEQLTRANTGFGGAAGALTALFDTVELTLWVTEQERWPVRIALRADQTGTEAIALRAEFTISDYNKSDITINAPN